MSVGCGTLSASFGLSTDYASSGGHMKDLPSNNPAHQVPEEFWNVDSNISSWGQHKTRRTAAHLAHSVHRHDQIQKLKLLGSDRPSNSGMLSADSCFLEAFGYSLGARDRQGRPCSIFLPVNVGRGFRSLQNFLETSVDGLYPSGVKARRVHLAYDQHGKTFAGGLRRDWDNWKHVTKREAAKLAQGVHSHATRGLKAGACYPQNNCEVNPAAIYSLKYRKFGEESSMHEYPRKPSLPVLVRKKQKVLLALKSIGSAAPQPSTGLPDGCDYGGALMVHKTPPETSTTPLSARVSRTLPR
ncbi:hypothetical protein FOZ62_015439 [Perkinsus olseni]|uniref:Uncharacterized protein n=1 Tax=Perkinsus olseni TaxID=32597 RepID=A0A7J6RJE6_PEROL|nr:hypothetical protein FOZ62_015439 [Perkinsus olseni]